MRSVLQTLSAIALAGTVVPSLAFLGGALSLEIVKWAMLFAMIAWFAITPFWMERKS